MTKDPKPVIVWLGRLGALVLGGVLLVALGAKALDPVAFAGQIRAEGLAGPGSARAMAFFALAVEAAIGALLVLLVRRWWVLLPTTALVGFFLFLNGRAWWRDSRGLLPEDATCGCFGNLVDRTPAEAFWQDLVLLVVPLVLAYLGRREETGFPTRRLLLAAVFTAGALVLAAKAPSLPLDDVATRLRPGTAIGSVCAGSDPRVCLADVAPELLEGSHWVALVDLGASPEDWVGALNERVWSGEEPPLVVLASGTPEEMMEFRFTQGPAFDVREAPPALLRPLYRTLPRSFLVDDGTVVVTSPGLPPSGADAPKNSGE